MNQELAAFVIVGIAAFAVLFSFFRKNLANPLAKIFLRRGSIKVAMKLKATAKKPGCDECK